MRRFALALVASIALIGSTAAADMPVKMPVKAPVIVPMYNWTGFYIGGNIGYSWGKQDTSLLTGGTTLFSNSNNINGIIGSGPIGYNWQKNQWVLGVEADFQGSGQKGDGTFGLPGFDPCAPVAVCPVPASTISYSDKFDWFAPSAAASATRWARPATGFPT